MAFVKGTNNSETINVFDGVTFGDDFILGYGGDDSIFGLARRRPYRRRHRRRCAPRWTRLRYGELLQLHRRHHGEPELRSGGRRRRGRRHLRQHRESRRQSTTRTRSSATTAATRSTDLAATTSSTAGTATTIWMAVGQRHAQGRRRCRRPPGQPGDRYGLLL